MGEYDGVTVYEVPDEATASALIMSVKGPGHLKEVKTTELHTVETAMEGMRKASQQSYQGPRLLQRITRENLEEGVRLRRLTTRRRA